MRTNHRLAVSFLFLLAVCLLVTNISAQGIVTGSITGTVQDPSAAVVQGASVTAVHVGTNSVARTTTNSAGTFQLPGLPVGNYTVSVEAAGFAGFKIEKVLVQAGTATSIGQVSLKVGASEAAVTVEAATALLQPDSVQISQEFDTEKTAD